MPLLRAVDANAQPWAPHRTFAGVYVRAVQDSETCADLEVRWIRIGPRAEIPAHTHEHSAETFYVLAGQGRFDLDGAVTPCRAGCCGFAEAGAIHRIQNTGADDLQLLAVFTPPLSR
jgi:mannose-6-phosphate isomerase-like protein (cupin superfamily)